MYIHTSILRSIFGSALSSLVDLLASDLSSLTLYALSTRYFVFVHRRVRTECRHRIPNIEYRISNTEYGVVVNIVKHRERTAKRTKLATKTFKT